MRLAQTVALAVLAAVAAAPSVAASLAPSHPPNPGVAGPLGAPLLLMSDTWVAVTPSGPTPLRGALAAVSWGPYIAYYTGSQVVVVDVAGRLLAAVPAPGLTRMSLGPGGLLCLEYGGKLYYYTPDGVLLAGPFEAAPGLVACTPLPGFYSLGDAAAKAAPGRGGTAVFPVARAVSRPGFYVGYGLWARPLSNGSVGLALEALWGETIAKAVLEGAGRANASLVGVATAYGLGYVAAAASFNVDGLYYLFVVAAVLPEARSNRWIVGPLSQPFTPAAVAVSKNLDGVWILSDEGIMISIRREPGGLAFTGLSSSTILSYASNGLVIGLLASTGGAPIGLGDLTGWQSIISDLEGSMPPMAPLAVARGRDGFLVVYRMPAGAHPPTLVALTPGGFLPVELAASEDGVVAYKASAGYLALYAVARAAGVDILVPVPSPPPPPGLACENPAGALSVGGVEVRLCGSNPIPWGAAGNASNAAPPACSYKANVTILVPEGSPRVYGAAVAKGEGCIPPRGAYIVVSGPYGPAAVLPAPPPGSYSAAPLRAPCPPGTCTAIVTLPGSTVELGYVPVRVEGVDGLEAARPPWGEPPWVPLAPGPPPTPLPSVGNWTTASPGRAGAAGGEWLQHAVAAAYTALLVALACEIGSRMRVGARVGAHD